MDDDRGYPNLWKPPNAQTLKILEGDSVHPAFGGAVVANEHHPTREGKSLQTTINQGDFRSLQLPNHPWLIINMSQFFQIAIAVDVCGLH